MKIKYEQIALRTKARDIIAKANAIIDEYAAQGYSLTLRQLYYQFVARGLLPNEQKNYKMLGEVISSGRRAGLIDWEAIVDRTRFIRGNGSGWDSPAGIIATCEDAFKYDLWKDQPSYIEIWFEKDALLGVFERACHQMRLPHFSCRGYVSDSECWGAAQRIARMERSGKRAFVMHFGDHDPSGIDMTRDIEARMNLFGASPIVQRLALNMDQVEQYNPPPNPAKETDSRFAGYRAEFGDESWELDALNPDVLASLVADAVACRMDLLKWKKGLNREAKAKKEIGLLAKFYDAAVKAAKEASK